MDNVDLNKLKDKYIEAAKIHGEATLAGNYKLGNKQVDIMENACKILRASEKGRLVLKEIIYHQNPSVKTAAARECLLYYTKEAEEVLEEVSRRDDIFGFNAQMTLSEWEKGNLKFEDNSKEKEKTELEANSQELNSSSLDAEFYIQILSSLDYDNPENFLKSLTEGERMVYSTLKLEEEVHNGGFNQYLWNAFPGDPELANEGYKLIGARKLADLIHNAVEMFMNELPNNGKYLKENTKESFTKSYQHTELGKLDTIFLKLVEEENPSKLRHNYINSHPKEFKLLN